MKIDELMLPLYFSLLLMLTIAAMVAMVVGFFVIEINAFGFAFVGPAAAGMVGTIGIVFKIQMVIIRESRRVVAPNHEESPTEN